MFADLRVNWMNVFLISLFFTDFDTFRSKVLVVVHDAYAATFEWPRIEAGAGKHQRVDIALRLKTSARALKHSAFGPVSAAQWYNRVVPSLASNLGQFRPTFGRLVGSSSC